MTDETQAETTTHQATGSQPEGVYVAITRSDGGVSIMFFVTKQQRHGADPGWTREASVPEIAYEIEKSRLDAVSFRIIPAEHVPADRTFRNAWQDPGKGQPLAVHMGKARDIHRDRLRQMRAPLLAALDVAFMRAHETDDMAAKKKIAAQKQALRDITAHPDIEKAKTPEELKAVLPDALKG